MKLKKLGAVLLAAIVMVTACFVMPITASAATAPYYVVKGNTTGWLAQFSAVTATLSEGSDTYVLSTTAATWSESDTFVGGSMSVYFFDPSGAITDCSVDSVTIGGTDVGVEKAFGDAVWGNYWDDTASAMVDGYAFTFNETDLATLGTVDAGEEIVITISATYDANAKSISKDNFTYSTLQNTEMEIGDSFTIKYDSENTPDTAKYSFKYKVPNETGYDYYAPVNENAVNADTSWNGAAATGLEVTASTSGTVTTYTFTAVSASVDTFELNIEVSALGDWSDTQYLWFDSATAYKVVVSEETAEATEEATAEATEEATAEATEEATAEATEEAETLDSGSYGDGTYQELSDDEIANVNFNGHKLYSDYKDTTGTTYAQYMNNGDASIYRIYKLVAEEDLADMTSASIVIKHNDNGKAYRLTSSKAYRKLTADQVAPEGYVYLAFVIDDAPSAWDTTSGYYRCDLKWTDITLS